MKIKIFFLINIFFFSSFIPLKKNNLGISDEDYYKFFNDVLDKNYLIENSKLKFPDLIKNKTIWIEDLKPFTEGQKKIFDSTDIDFFFTQCETRRVIELDFNKLNNIKASKKNIKETSYKLSHPMEFESKDYDFTGIIHDLSIPIFSKNKKYAILEYSDYCGLECSFYGVILYELINNKWSEIGTIGTIIMS